MYQKIDVLWMGGRDCIGIVKAKSDQTDEIRYFIGKGDGLSEEEDIKRIIDWGSPIYPEIIERFLKG